jgi:hypothetical protein
MRRRGFLQLAGAAVLGVLASRVPVSVSTDTVALAELAPTGEVSVWVYPSLYALPVRLEGVLAGRTITVPRMPDAMDSTWTVGGFELGRPSEDRSAYLVKVDAIEEAERQRWNQLRWLRGTKRWETNR